MLRALLLAVLLTTGCLPDVGGPDDLNPGPCDHDGVCDPGEDCPGCPGDCDCCIARSAIGVTNVKDPGNAVGQPDGKFAQLAPGSSLVLTLGRPIVPGMSGAIDFKLTGTVDSPSSITNDASNCPVAADLQDGAVIIYIGETGDTWALAGHWTRTVVGGSSAGRSKNTAVFSLACTGAHQGTKIRLEAMSKASARIDALNAPSCLGN